MSRLPESGELVFWHPSRHLNNQTLVVDIKPDQIVWGYGLNTANFPTYGGEVIQILSCFIDDLTVTGTTRSYANLEAIYSYFIDYFQVATQGYGANFDPNPITMTYPHRGWTFQITPKALPSFRYGRDVVAPEWSMTAAVQEPEPELQTHIIERAQALAIQSEGDVRLFGKVTGDIGYDGPDPFRTPFVTEKGKLYKPTEGEISNAYGHLGDWYNHLIPAYLGGDFRALGTEYSRPAFYKFDPTGGEAGGSTPNQAADDVQGGDSNGGG